MEPIRFENKRFLFSTIHKNWTKSAESNEMTFNDLLHDAEI